MTNLDLAATALDQGRASVIKMIEGNAGYDAGYVAWSESSVILTFSQEGGSGRNSGRIRCLDVGKGIVENCDCGVGGAVHDNPIKSRSDGNGVRKPSGESLEGVCTAFVIGSKTRARLA